VVSPLLVQMVELAAAAEWLASMSGQDEPEHRRDLTQPVTSHRDPALTHDSMPHTAFMQVQSELSVSYLFIYLLISKAWMTHSTWYSMSMGVMVDAMH